MNDEAPNDDLKADSAAPADEAIEKKAPQFPPFVVQAQPPQDQTAQGKLSLSVGHGCVLVIGNGLASILGGITCVWLETFKPKPKGDFIFPPWIGDIIVAFLVGMVLGPALFSFIWFCVVSGSSAANKNDRKR